MEKQITILLEKCFILIKKGYSVQYCLSKYNKHRKELEGYLQDIANLKKIIPVKFKKDYLEDNLYKIYNKVENETVEQNPNIQYKKPLILKPAIIFLNIFFAILFSFSGVIYASQSSIPGNSLYLIKRGVEDIKIITYPESMRGSLYYKILKSRIYEATILLKNNDSDNLIINDLIEEIDLVFIQCQKCSYFGNKTEEEILKIIQLIKLKQKQRLDEDERDSELDLGQIFEEEYDSEPDNQDGGSVRDSTETETEYPDTEENNSEIYDYREDIQPDIDIDSDTDHESDDDGNTSEDGDDSEGSDDTSEDGDDSEGSDDTSEDDDDSEGSDDTSEDDDDSEGSDDTSEDDDDSEGSDDTSEDDDDSEGSDDTSEDDDDSEDD